MPDRATLLWLLRQAGVPARKLDWLPRFLVISPPKTGSTWLADNLRLHPRLHVPALKEVRYFSCFTEWLGLEWYLDHFSGAGGRAAGEASPSYALLPDERIRLVRELMPDVKLVYLLRDPVARAWSHARHTRRFGEGAFAGRPPGPVTERDWLDSLAHPWVYGSGDYANQLRRWLAVFPRDQLFVGFLEDVGRRPEALFREVLAFLGVDHELPLDGFPIAERANAGVVADLAPGLERHVRRMEHARTLDLIGLLRDRLHLAPPPEWGWWREPFEPTPTPTVPEDVLRLEETLPSACRECGTHAGYELICAQGRFFADGPGGRFESDDLATLKARIDAHHLAERGRAEDALRREATESRQEAAELRRRVRELEANESRLAHLEAVVAQLAVPLSVRMKRWVRRAVGVSA